PKSMKGFVTACFLVTNTLGNFLNMFWMTMYGGSLVDPVEKRGTIMPGQFFGITALVVAAPAVAFIFVGRHFERSPAPARAEPAPGRGGGGAMNDDDRAVGRLRNRRSAAQVSPRGAFRAGSVCPSPVPGRSRLLGLSVRPGTMPSVAHEVKSWPPPAPAPA